MTGSTRTKKGRSGIAGSHKLPDHWEHGDLIVLHGTKPGEPVLRVCIRGSRCGDSTRVDMKSQEADRFARCIFSLAGYAVPEPRQREDVVGLDAIRLRQSSHWNVYATRQRSGRRRNHICIFNHGMPVHCRASYLMPRTKIEAFAEWLAPRLGWDLYEEEAA